jgi:phosphoglycerate dehydrogenase-like enzyme
MSIPTPSELPETINIIIATGVPERRIEQIRAVAPDRLNVTNAYGDLVPVMANDWPERTMSRLTAGAPAPSHTQEELDRLIRNAHVVVIGQPYPMHLSPSPEKAFWVHNIRAGASRIEDSDFWRGPTFTISRGYSNALPVAETAFAAALMFAKRLDFATRNTASGNTLQPQPPLVLVSGKTMGIWGLGGIGGHVARLAKAVGMRVVGLRRSATARQTDVDGVDVLYPPSELHEFLAECDFVTLALNLTKETERMLGAPELAAMKDSAFLLNIARGELIDEPAMIEALHTGKIAGAYIDAWTDETNRPPPPELLAAPNLVFTPHISNRTDGPSGDDGIDLLCENLRRMFKGEALKNVFDWDRGY